MKTVMWGPMNSPSANSLTIVDMVHCGPNRTAPGATAPATPPADKHERRSPRGRHSTVTQGTRFQGGHNPPLSLIEVWHQCLEAAPDSLLPDPRTQSKTIAQHVRVIVQSSYCPVDAPVVLAPTRMTPTLFSIAMVVPKGFDSVCNSSRVRRAISGDGVFGIPISDIGRPVSPRSTG